ncbi:MAG: PP2C family serine/threonine-protein phosphatase [Flavobacteriaceae bacterium]|nr:PP2C family serine/threonine-protein phosphatase [Flavobacteriaceae bacterium]
MDLKTKLSIKNKAQSEFSKSKTAKKEEIVNQHMVTIKSGETHIISPLKKGDIYYSFGLSVQGKSHKKHPITPCQDYHKFGTLSDIFNYAIVSDGAGSGENSHIGSKLACETLSRKVEDFLNEFDLKNQLSNNEWHEIAHGLFKDTRKALQDHSKSNNIELDSLKCTLILIIQMPFGILSANIGDGRAGCLKENLYHSLIVPFQTYVVGATFFLTGHNWNQFFRTEIHLITDVDAFFALTDGCDNFSFLQKGPIPKNQFGVYDEVHNEARYDHNQPFAGFFDAFIGQMKELILAKQDIDVTQVAEEIIDLGIFKGEPIQGIQKEDDDKTMVIFFKE